MKSVENSAVAAAQHRCQRFIEIGQFLFIDVYKLRKRRVQNQRADVLRILFEDSHHQTAAVRDTHEVQRVDAQQAAKVFDICRTFIRVVGGEVNAFPGQLLTALSDRRKYRIVYRSMFEVSVLNRFPFAFAFEVWLGKVSSTLFECNIVPVP